MEDNRHFQRVRLSRPVDGQLGAARVQVVDVSRVGLQIHHQDAIPVKGQACLVQFPWNRSAIRLRCTVVWTAIHRAARSSAEKSVYSSGLRVEPSDAMACAPFMNMITSLTEESAARSNGSAGTPLPFLVCELVGGEWRTRRSSTRDQPPQGFTVSADEDGVQVQRLCAAYLAADAETRKLIRSLSALSVSGSAAS